MDNLSMAYVQVVSADSHTKHASHSFCCFRSAVWLQEAHSVSYRAASSPYGCYRAYCTRKQPLRTFKGCILGLFFSQPA